jgi:hypothetical protein
VGLRSLPSPMWYGRGHAANRTRLGLTTPLARGLLQMTQVMVQPARYENMAAAAAPAVGLVVRAVLAPVRAAAVPVPDAAAAAALLLQALPLVHHPLARTSACVFVCVCAGRVGGGLTLDRPCRQARGGAGLAPAGGVCRLACCGARL